MSLSDLPQVGEEQLAAVGEQQQPQLPSSWKAPRRQLNLTWRDNPTFTASARSEAISL